MTNLNPSMRLKVKRDTFFLPDPNSSGVYFRNNVSTFRMEGSMIEKWVEKLLPMLNGENTLESLTNGLSGPYRERVYQIAETLYHNGFVRDVSKDRPHQLSEPVLINFASQIEFVDHFVDSGAYRFQAYRQASVLAVGSGSFLISLVSSLLESGLPKFHMLITDRLKTNRQRLAETVEHSRKKDADVEIEEVMRHERAWQEIIKPFDYILYVSETGDVEELRFLHKICREEKKVFLPAICFQQGGLAGPVVYPDSKECWESVWNRIHRSAIFKNQESFAVPSTASAMLANVAVFELFKDITGVSSNGQKNQFFLLDLETMEGNWHPFVAHPLVTGQTSARLVEDIKNRIVTDLQREDSGQLLLSFNQMTSKVSGIFHLWEEGDLQQLPLAQCRVQPVNPLIEGPAELLQEIVCNGLTHEEARREAGLSGVEAYASKMANKLDLPANVMFGTGETFTEAICRGLQRCLDEELIQHIFDDNYAVTRVELETIEDERCRLYLRALTMMQGEPVIAKGDDVSGFPVIWVGTSDGWFGNVDFNHTMALRRALQQPLLKVQNQADIFSERSIEISSLILTQKEPLRLTIPLCEERIQSENLMAAMEVLERNGKQLLIYEIDLEPVFKKELAGVFGVMIQEEGLT